MHLTADCRPFPIFGSFLEPGLCSADCQRCLFQIKPDRLGSENRLEFFALSLIAEIGAAFAGFAALAGIIRHDELEADSVFDVVLHSMIAVVFAVVAILFAGSGVWAAPSLRLIAGALLLTSLLAMLREFRVYQAAWRHLPDEKREANLGNLFGIGGLVCMLPSPILAGVVAAGIFPSRAPLLYELAVLSHLLVAIQFLLYVVWRNLALRAGQP